MWNPPPAPGGAAADVLFDVIAVSRKGGSAAVRADTDWVAGVAVGFHPGSP